MVKLDRYIGTQVFFSILAVLGIILGLALLFAFIDELGDVQGKYGLGEALSYVMLTAPRRAYEMLPMAALIGSLIGLGSLASNSELTIMRAAGVSIGRIVWAVMKPLLVLILVLLILLLHLMDLNILPTGLIPIGSKDKRFAVLFNAKAHATLVSC